MPASLSTPSPGINMAFNFLHIFLESVEGWGGVRFFLLFYYLVKMKTFRAHTSEIINTQQKTIWLSPSKSSEIIFTLWTGLCTSYQGADTGSRWTNTALKRLTNPNQTVKFITNPRKAHEPPHAVCIASKQLWLVRRSALNQHRLCFRVAYLRVLSGGGLVSLLVNGVPALF